MRIEQSLEMIINRLNTINGINITMDSFTIEGPFANDGVTIPSTWVDGDTVMKVTMKEGYYLTGERYVGYDRINLSVAHGMLGGRLYIPDDLTSTKELATFFSSRHEIGIEESDIVDTPIDYPSGKVTVSIAPGSIGWDGSAEFDIYVLPAQIADYVAVKDIELFDDIDKVDARYATYSSDFTGRLTAMESITLGTDSLAVIANVLTTEMGLPFVADDSEALYSLYGATVTYAGATDGAPFANTEYSHVVHVRLDDTLTNAEMFGTIVMHYNDGSSSDPNVV